MDTTAAASNRADRFRGLLEAERRRLTDVQDAAARLSAAAELTSGDSSDQLPAEQTGQDLERELDLGVLQRVDHELEEVTAALERLEADRYGLCEKCGRPIGDERLEVVPAARYCVEDQAKLQRSRV